ncbi:hypothetical protein SynSYN20_00800 [Synechococcus sp. SYN20]|nr:hypothetical protein SynSYN20_00800 [Synechococcus sp. SYN20]
MQMHHQTVFSISNQDQQNKTHTKNNRTLYPFIYSFIQAVKHQ